MIANFRNGWALRILGLVILVLPLNSIPARASSGPGDSPAHSRNNSPAPATYVSTVPRDNGQRDFDFAFGSWKVHLRRLVHPLSGSHVWADYDGTTVVRKIWNGRANLGELEVEDPATHTRIEGLSLRLYNPQSRQWSIYFANSKEGVLGLPPMIGEFKNGRGEFYDQEEFEGRAIFVRFVFSDITPNSYRFVQSFSADGARTWEPNWVATFTREDRAVAETKAALAKEAAGQRDFDFELGTWKMRVKRLLHPLTGSHVWVDFSADSFTRKVWGGRAQLEQFEGDAASGHLEGMTLRLFDPQSHEWRLYWATSKDGSLGVPQIGQFTQKGRGEFYAQDFYQGRAVLIRFIWTVINPNLAHFEQSFSEDGGKTWEVNWITDDTRVK
jgi:hypothetical protein